MKFSWQQKDWPEFRYDLKNVEDALFAFAAEPKGFEGGMTAKKYITITKASKPTATRDLQELVDLKILIAQGGGRSTHYSLNLKVQTVE